MEQVQELAARLVIPGLPAWSGLGVLLVLALFALAWLCMPFSVFGLKSRMEVMEAQLEDIQGEIRALAMRLAEMPRPGPGVSNDYMEILPPRRELPPEVAATPPVPPPPARPEPRLDWPTAARR
jgi:hypothetical protein